MLPLLLSWGSYDGRGMAAAPALSARIDWAGTGWRSSSFVGLLGLYSDQPPLVPAIDKVHPSAFQFNRGRSGDFSADATGSATLTLLNDDDAYTPDRNWCDNPSFEVGTAGWENLAPPGFTNPAASLVRVTGDAAAGAGSACAEIAFDATLGDRFVRFLLPYTFRAGVTYVLGFAARVTAGATGFNYQAYFGFSNTDKATVAVSIGAGYARSSLTWTPSADRASAYIGLGTIGAVSGTLHLDAVQVNAGSVENAYLEAPTKGQLLPGRPVHVAAAWGSGIYPQFFGFVERITPTYADRTVAVTCYDPLRLMSRKNVALPTRSRTHREIRLDALNAFRASWRNLLEVNPSFEANTTGWSTSSGTFTQITTDAAPVLNAGSACAEAVNAGGAIVRSPTVPIVLPVDGTVRLSFWAKSISGNAVLQASPYSAGDAQLLADPRSFTLTTSWARYTVVWLTAVTASDITLHFVIGGAATWRMDAVMLTLGPEDREYAMGAGGGGTLEQNYLDDPSFETKPVTVNWDNLRTNLITNPSFETDTSGWSIAGDSFVTAAVSFTRSTADSVHGSATGELDVSTGQHGVFFAISGTFKAGTAYRASVYCRFAGGAAGQVTLGIGSNGTPADKIETFPTVTGTWTRLGVTWIPSADRTDVHLYVGKANITNINIYIDAAMVIVGSSDIPFNDPLGYGVPATSFARVTTDASSGMASMEVVTSAVNQSGVRYTSLGVRKFLAGVPYTFICSIKGVSGNAALAIGIGSESVQTDSAKTAFTATGTWTRLGVTWIPSADRTDVVIFLRMESGAASATFRVDGCALYPGSTIFSFEPDGMSLDAENGRAPDHTLTGNVLAGLAAVNAVTLSHHFVRPLMVNPWYSYISHSQATLAAAASVETYDEDISDMSGFDFDRAAVVNVQAVTAGTKYIDANGVTQATGSYARTVFGADRLSTERYGRIDGAAIDSPLLEAAQGDPLISQALADTLVARYRDPHPRPIVAVENRWPSQLQRELDDLITINFARLRIVNGRYLILRLDTRVSEAGQRWETKLSLEESPY